MSCLRGMWSWMVEWGPYVLSPLANGALVFLGVWLSLPDFAEGVEKNPRKRKILAGLCIGLGLIGFVADVRVRHESDKTSTKLLGDVETALTKTNELLTKSDLLGTRIQTLATQLAGQATTLDKLHTELEAAREKHDPQKVHDLEAKAQEAQQQADRIAHELRVLTLAHMAKAIAANLNVTALYWRADDHNAYMGALDSPCYGILNKGDNCAHAQAQWVITEKQLNARWQEKAKDLVNQANECRVEILTRLLPQQKGLAQDEAAKSLYERMVADSKNISPESLSAAGSYLDNLWKRLPLNTQGG